jgi:hypothetical protein
MQYKIGRDLGPLTPAVPYWKTLSGLGCLAEASRIAFAAIVKVKKARMNTLRMGKDEENEMMEATRNKKAQVFKSGKSGLGADSDGVAANLDTCV